MSLLNANKKALDSPELVCLEEYGIFPELIIHMKKKKVYCTINKATFILFFLIYFYDFYDLYK